MSSKVELNKNGRPVNWHGQCWTYYKRMMEFVFADKDVLEYATASDDQDQRGSHVEVPGGHIAGTSQNTPFGKGAEKVRGFKKQFAAAPAGHGTVELVVERNGKKMTMNLLDAYHVPNCRNLLSHSQAEDQGYAVEYHGRSGQTKFELWREDELRPAWDVHV
ncbi:hypothetical protein PF002_g20036 [Phytophthora fragariae]|uniref:Uncharacterized protein n=1 Tax=Phytophthora fragariae TaxID=53985 RepID=A0A6A3XZN5_9STRA|nr:hypothetical protein PF002_g20036 [Phytophthora fragariae]